MTLDKSGAAEALAEIRQSQSRSAQLYSYTQFAPPLFLTGLMWLVVDVTFYLAPAVRPWIWPVATALSLPAFALMLFIIGRRRKSAASAPTAASGAGIRAKQIWRGVICWGLAFVFVWGTFAILGPVSGVQVHSFISFLTGIAYVLAGLWMGWRVLATGVAVAALTMVGHFYVSEELYTLYMGVIAGGGMMLSALWMRRV